MQLMEFSEDIDTLLRPCIEAWTKHEKIDFYLLDMYQKRPLKEWLVFVESIKKKETTPFGYCVSRNYALVYNNECLGFVSIRLESTAYILNYLGHIGYSIAYDKRSQGYGTLILKLAIEKCKELKLKELIITCDEGNIASKKIILKNGAVYVNTFFSDDEYKERYLLKMD